MYDIFIPKLLQPKKIVNIMKKIDRKDSRDFIRTHIQIFIISTYFFAKNIKY